MGPCPLCMRSPHAIALAVLAALAAAAHAAVGWAARSPRFAVGKLEIVQRDAGNARVTRDTLLRRAGLAPGTNVFAVDLDAIEASIEREPWVARARAERMLPNRVRVTVVERQPAAVVRLGALYLADASGRLFKRAAVERGEADGLVVISGLDRRLWTTSGISPDAGPALIRQALAVVARWHVVPERPTIGEVELGRAGTTLFTLEGARAVRLGRASEPADLDERFSRFDAAWGALTAEERARARTIHLDSATRRDRVTVRLAQGKR